MTAKKKAVREVRMPAPFSNRCEKLLEGFEPSFEFTPVDPLPPRLGRPSIVSLSLSSKATGSGTTLQYHPGVVIKWQAPSQDSTTVV